MQFQRKRKHATISLVWEASEMDLNASAEHLAYKCGSSSYPATVGHGIGMSQEVGRESFNQILDEVKGLCKVAADNLIKELSAHFPASNVMDAPGVVYPQYWLQPNAEQLFEGHFMVLKEHYCVPRSVGEVHAPPMLDLSALNHQASQFKGAMLANSPDAMQKPIMLNPLTKLWRTLSMSKVLKAAFGEWFKVVDLAAVQVLGSVEDECTFSTISFSTSKLRNHLSDHLHAAVGVYCQNFYTLDTFPFDKVYEEWHKDKKSRTYC